MWVDSFADVFFQEINKKTLLLTRSRLDNIRFRNPISGFGVHWPEHLSHSFLAGNKFMKQGGIFIVIFLIV